MKTPRPQAVCLVLLTLLLGIQLQGKILMSFAPGYPGKYARTVGRHPRAAVQRSVCFRACLRVPARGVF
jgi:hypothetical protein